MGDHRHRDHLTWPGTLTLLGGGAGGGSGVVIPGALNWTDCYGGILAHTNSQTLSLITVPINLTAGASGGGNLHYSLNGGSAAYVGAFSVAAGDTLLFSIVNTGTSSVAGTVTVENASDSFTVLDTFNYTVTGAGP